MSNRVSIGFFIRRSIADAHAVRGKTFSAYGRKLYPTREQEQQRLDAWTWGGIMDRRFTYDVCEAFMHIDEEARGEE